MLYTLEITLQSRNPLNQRIIEINDNQNFATLAQIICELYGFSGDHLWEYKKDDTLVINHPDFVVEDHDTIFEDPDFDDLQGVARNVSSSSFTLSDYFSSNTIITFIYDFGENWRFDVRFTQSRDAFVAHPQEEHPRAIISGIGNYLIEDSGGPIGLKEYIDQYVHQKRDGDWRETYEDFSERIQPAMRKFNIRNHLHTL